MSEQLKDCKACGHQISRYSPFCRNCGHPQSSVLAVWLLVVFLLVSVAVYLAATLLCLCHVHEF